MKKWLIKLIIGVVILIVVVVGIRFVVRKVLTGEGISKITEKVTEGVAKKAKEIAEKVQVEEEVATEEAGEEAEATAKKVSPGKMNDEKWVEVFAYSQYRVAKYGEESEKIKTTAGYAQVAEKYTKDIENMYKRVGVTEDEFSAYNDKLTENPERYMKLIEQAGKRVEELQKTGK